MVLGYSMQNCGCENIPFITKYPRPEAFSNPWQHFPPTEIVDILKRSDEELRWPDFYRIFHYSTPAGSYAETVYFLPWALKNMKDFPDESMEYMGGLFCYIDDEVESLESDGLFSLCTNALRQIFTAWTGHFNVVHFDHDECKRRGWALQYNDYVEHREAIVDFIDYLCRYESFKAHAINTVKFLSSTGNDDIRSSWFLEYVCQIRMQHEDYSKRESTQMAHDRSKYSTPTKGVPEIFKIVEDNELARFHYAKIARSIITHEKSPTYWQDIKRYLKL